MKIILVSQPTVCCQIHQLTLIVADQGYRIIKIDGLDQSAYDLLHGLQGIVNIPHNTTGDAWTEEFSRKCQAVRWLRGKFEVG